MQPVLTFTDSGEKVLLLADEYREIIRDQKKGEAAVLRAESRRVCTGEVADQGEVGARFHGYFLPLLPLTLPALGDMARGFCHSPLPVE
jgi:hypothetical protein